MKNKWHNLLVSLFALMGFAVAFVAGYYFFSTSNLNISLTIRLVFLLLMGLDALGYFIVAWGLNKKIGWIYLFAIVLLAINILGLIFDDIGLADILAALFNLLLLLLVIKSSRRKK